MKKLSDSNLDIKTEFQFSGDFKKLKISILDMADVMKIKLTKNDLLMHMNNISEKEFSLVIEPKIREVQKQNKMMEQRKERELYNEKQKQKQKEIRNFILASFEPRLELTANEVFNKIEKTTKKIYKYEGILLGLNKLVKENVLNSKLIKEVTYYMFSTKYEYMYRDILRSCEPNLMLTASEVSAKIALIELAGGRTYSKSYSLSSDNLLPVLNDMVSIGLIEKKDDGKNTCYIGL